MKISIVTPSFQQGKFIERTLQSVAKQVVHDCDIEYVVFDGGSVDQTVDVLKQFDFANFRWISKKDKGQANAVNQGILATDGDIIGWLNSDDVYYDGAISRVVEYFNANPEIDVVYGMADHIDLEDRPFESYPTEVWNFDRLKETCFICQPASFFRRKVIVQHGLLDESLNYCMDYEFWLRLGKAGVNFGYIEEKIAGSRLYADNKTLGSRVNVHKEINDMFKKLFNKVPNRWLYNYAHTVVDSRFNQKDKPKRYQFDLALMTIISAIRWNGGLSRAMWKDIIKRWL